MTRSELAEALATRKGLPLAVADRIIDEILGSMSKTLVSNERIEIRGFGSFENRHYDSYTGRNPKTGEPITVKPKKTPFFKVGRGLKERIEKSNC